MGMFDSVFFDCADHECDGKVEFQDHFGECALKKFVPSYVPIETAKSLEGTTAKCSKCEKVHTFHMPYLSRFVACAAVIEEEE